MTILKFLMVVLLSSVMSVTVLVYLPDLLPSYPTETSCKSAGSLPWATAGDQDDDDDDDDDVPPTIRLTLMQQDRAGSARCRFVLPTAK